MLERLSAPTTCCRSSLPGQPWSICNDLKSQKDLNTGSCLVLQAKEALKHPYFDNLDKATIDLLESETLRERDAAEV